MRKNEADHNEYVDPFSIQAKELALSFDEATDENDLDRLEALLDKAQKLVLSENEPSQAYLFYSMGTVYSDFSKLKGISFQESVKKRLYFFRKSIGIIEKEEYMDKLYEPYMLGFKEVLYTNYANALDDCGRKIAAIDYLKKVLAINDSFGMALGNLGRAYQHYASLEYDETHRDIFHHYAYKCFVDALKSNDPNTHQEAKKAFSISNSARAKTHKPCYNIISTANGVMTDETHRRNQQRSDNDDRFGEPDTVKQRVPGNRYILRQAGYGKIGFCAR